VVYLDPVPSRVDEDVLHVSICDSILHWSAADLTKSASELNAYQVMKKWLELDRWNRRYRKMGLQNQIHWRTNQVPSQGGTTLLWNPHRAEIALAEVIPAVQLVGMLAINEPGLAVPVSHLISSMRARGIDPDPEGTIGLVLRFNSSRDHLREELADHDSADVAVCIDSSSTSRGITSSGKALATVLALVLGGSTSAPTWMSFGPLASRQKSIQIRRSLSR
jgi:hypothetical protein